MKTTLLLTLALLSSLAFGQGDAPPFIKGQSQTTQSVSSVLEVPNAQATKTSSSKARLETGNKNVLTNPSFEHLTFDTGWSSSCTSTAVLTKTVNTTTKIDGVKSANLSVAGGASGGVCTFYQAATTTQAVQGVASAYISTNTPTYLTTNPVMVYARKNGVNQLGGVAVVTGSLMPYKVPVELGSISTGIALEVTVVAGQTITVTIDDAFVGAENLKVDGQEVKTQSLIVPSAASTTTNLASGTMVGSGLFTVSGATLTALKPSCYSGSHVVQAVSSLTNEGISVNVDKTGTPVVSFTDVGRSTASGVGIGANAAISVCLLTGETLAFSASSSGTSISTRTAIYATEVTPNITYSQPYYATDRIGEVFDSTNPIAPSGFISALGSVIGETTSAATFKGQAYWPLYKHIWNDVAGLTTTAGYPYRISSAKGASAEADWTANKTITVDYATNALFRRAKKAAATLGSYTDDTFQGHKHSFTVTNTGFGSNNGIGRGDGTVLTAMNAGSFEGGLESDGTNGTPRGGLETAPDHTSMYVYIRYQADNQVAVLNLSGLETCADSYECTDDFSVDVTSAGAIVTGSENIPWVSSVTKSATGVYDFVYRAGLKGGGQNLSSPMNCTVTNGRFTAQRSTNTSTGITITHRSAADAFFDTDFTLTCQKRSADYHGKTAKAVASDQNVRSIGAIGVDVQRIHISTTCSASPCAIYRQVGTKISTVTWSSFTDYRVNGIDGSKYLCTCNTASPATKCYHDMPNSTSTYARIRSDNDLSSATIDCTGIP